MAHINYNKSGDMIEIIVRDYSGAKIETHTCPLQDKRKYGKILAYLKDKYGFEPEIPADKSVPSSLSAI